MSWAGLAGEAMQLSCALQMVDADGREAHGVPAVVAMRVSESTATLSGGAALGLAEQWTVRPGWHGSLDFEAVDPGKPLIGHLFAEEKGERAIIWADASQGPDVTAKTIAAGACTPSSSEDQGQ